MQSQKDTSAVNQHVNGRTPGVDSELQEDDDIYLSRETAQSANTRTTQSSAKSRKTNRSSKMSELMTDRSNFVRSRGRPIKPHETEPFLSIDNLPPDKSFVTERTGGSRPPSNHGGKVKSPAYVSQLQRMTSYMSPYNQATPGPPRFLEEIIIEETLEEDIIMDCADVEENQLTYRSVPSRSGRMTPSNTPYHSPNKTLRTPNHHVKSPFKHAVNKPDLVLEGRETPSMGLKERTSLAAYHVTKIMSLAGEKETKRIPGKLQKGKLKPLYPVSVQGPKITQCRGIISETKNYQASPSRTLQRRIHLINTIPNVHEYLYNRPQTVESVHQTSVASSIDDFGPYDDNLDSNRSLPDEIIYAEQSELYVEPVAPENTFVPIPGQETQGVEQVSKEVTPRMFATEVAQGDLDNTDIDDVDISSKLQHELYVGNRNNSNNSNYSGGETAKEDTFPELDGDRGRTSIAQNNPNNPGNTRLGSSKSVRFLDGDNKPESSTSKELKQIANSNIAKQQREKSGPDGKVDEDSKRLKNGQGSCKDDLIVADKRKKDDDSDDERKEKDDSSRKENADKINGAETGMKKDNNKSVSGNTGGNDDNSGKKMSGDRQKAQNASVDRCMSPTLSSRNRSMQSDRPGTPKSGKCQKFSKSPASMSHTHTLQVAGMIHGDTYHTTLRPESPSRVRCYSPNQSFISESNLLRSTDTRSEEFQFFSKKTKPCFETEEDNFWSNVYSQRSKVKFMLEGEKPEITTIFLEDGDNVNVKLDEPITFEVIDNELENMRLVIHNTLQQAEKESKLVAEEEAEEEKKEDVDEVLDSKITNADRPTSPEDKCNDLKTDIVEQVDIESVRGEYSNLLDRYRQRCMDRSESYGALSGKLITPRMSTQGTNNKSRGNSAGHSSIGPSSVDDSENWKLDASRKMTQCSDSGRGSADNLSEWSRSASQARSEIPRLDLGSSVSDLGLDTGRSDMTLTEEPENQVADKTLLELVCDELSPLEKKKETLEARKDLEEDTSKLKVVATTKSLSKPKQQKSVPSLKPQLPPLCFSINARPPAGYLYYFAYGPDMNPNRLSSYIQREITKRFWGLLFGFSLVFNKKGSSEEAGGFANLEYNPLRSVEGCLYTITQQELAVLDKCVGYPQHYEHLMLPVWLSNSLEPDSVGVAQYCVPAIMYIAQNEWTETEKTLPCDYALSQCIKSADLLTPDYKRSLVSMAAQQVKVTA